MSISSGVIKQMESLKDEQMSVVLKLVNYYTQSDIDVFNRICDEELQNPVDDDLIDSVINDVRRGNNSGDYCS